MNRAFYDMWDNMKSEEQKMVQKKILKKIKAKTCKNFIK